MTPTLSQWINAAARVGAKKQIEDTRKRIYKLSSQLPNDEGYMLMKEYDLAITSANYLGRNEGESHDN